MRRALQVVFLLLVLAALAQAYWQHSRLPAVVATHFNAEGRANGWMSREAHTAWHVGLLLFIALLMEGIARLNARLPDEYVNIPHREYWLEPARRAATHGWLQNMLRLIGCMLMILFIGLFHQVYRANLNDTRMIAASTGLLIAGFLTGVAVLTGVVFLRFNRKPA